MTTLNAAFESKLALEDEGYASSSENFNIPTPLRRTTKIHHVSSVENASFGPDPVTPHNTGAREPHHRPVCRCLTYSSSEEDDDDDAPMDEFPSPDHIPPVQNCLDVFQWPSSPLKMSITLEEEEDMEEDFQTVPARGWALEYGRNPWQTSMYSWTFLTTWTMSIPVPIYKLPDIIILWHTGFKQYLQVWGLHDHVQQWRHLSTQGYWILKRLRLDMNI